MVTKCLSCELKQYGISVISMHPGWVQTDMGTSAAPLTKDESMSLFVKTLGKITPEQTGQFFDWKGDKLPW
jgi:NAD(P)-dependent dehydrogenase (short-subunit alcohol dehydrogenase family)